MIKIEQLKMQVGFCDEDLKAKVAEQLNISHADISNVRILKQAIDARKKPNVFYVLNVAVSLKNNLESNFEHLKYNMEERLLNFKKINYENRPIIVGLGPAGMFCGLAMAKMGLNPIIIEQGKKIEERQKDVLDFWNLGKLNKHSNVVFGEGGAGTFSDGKLNTNLDNEYCQIVLNEFVRLGAPKEILYMSKPHIGSDNLKNIVTSFRNEILNLGGEILFSHKLTEIYSKNNNLVKIEVDNLENNEKTFFETKHLILCLGHSARDTFEMLYKNGIEIKQKPFAMGVRIEQKQEDINQNQYGKNYDKRLPNADYKLAVHLDNNRSVFTFCMCPGGVVVASNSDENQIVTNGMSYFARDKENANCAVLVNVMPNDFESSHALAGIYFQQKYEKLAFEMGGKNYFAPCQSVASFLGKKECKTKVIPSYKPNVTFCDLKKCLPDFVFESLFKGLPLLNKKLSNFAKDENVLTGIESRSSSPITILRNENFESNIKGIFPCGEGCGYAGGIVSSAQDGIKVAEEIYKNLQREKKL